MTEIRSAQPTLPRPLDTPSHTTPSALAHLNQFLPAAAALAMLVWVGQAYVEHSPLALGLLLLIGLVFMLGAWNLHRYRRDTTALQRQLAAMPGEAPSAVAWLARLPASLRGAVRARIEGQWLALPAPTLAPFLTGLLVLLGMLGTFLGMVATLRGTGLALQSAADVQAIRGLLSAPVQGLGQAFGTSVAGVAASALLGLMGTAARRERVRATQDLDAAIAGGPLAACTPAARAAAASAVAEAAAQARQQQALERAERAAGQAAEQAAQALAAQQATWAQQHLSLMQALQGQQDVLERLAQRVGRTAEEGEARAASLQQQVAQQLHEHLGQTLPPLTERLGELTQALRSHSRETLGTLQQTQARFEAETRSSVQALADSVRTSLQRSLGQELPAAVQAVVQSTVQSTALSVLSQAQAAIAPVLEQTLQQMGQTQAALSHTVNTSAQAQLQHTRDALDALLASVAEHSRSAQSSSAQLLEQHSQSVLRQLQQQHAQWQEDWAQAQRLWSQSQQAALKSGAEQARAHTEATTQQMQALVQAAGEAPRSAAELMGQLRQTLSDSLVRDTATMAEREQTLQSMQQLMQALALDQQQQRAARDTLMEQARSSLQAQADAFSARVDDSSQQLTLAREQAQAAAAGIERWTHTLEQAVQQWGSSSAALAQQLQGIEQALAHSLARSDEQLAYYVAQAREVVDLTLDAHQQMVNRLQASSAPGASASATAARLPEAA